jgi:hypothetical protein
MHIEDAGRLKTWIRSGVVVAVTAIVAFATSAFGGATAQAALGPCRSDPVVVLSNLKTMDISALIQGTSSDLKSVTYTLHVPPGVRPLVVIPTDGLVGQVEHFAWHADQPSGSYAVDTYASTGTTVPVTASVIGVLAASGTATGTSNEAITVRG